MTTSHNAFLNIMDYTSVGIAVGTLTEVLPDIAAVLSITWLAIRIYKELCYLWNKNGCGK